MRATATKDENDGRQWYLVQFHECEYDTPSTLYARCADGSYIDEAGERVTVSNGNRWDREAIRAIERAK